MRNKDGKPVPLMSWDSQHPHNQPLWLYAMTGDPAAWLEAYFQVQAVLSHPVCWDSGYRAINAREIGWSLRRLAEGYQAGITPEDCLAGMRVIVERLEHGANGDWRTKRGSFNGVPWMVLTDNNPSTPGIGEQGDHGFCEVDVGKTAIVYLGLRDWRSVLESEHQHLPPRGGLTSYSTPSPLDDWVRLGQLMAHAAWVIETAAKRAKGGHARSLKWPLPADGHVVGDNVNDAVVEGVWYFPPQPGAYWSDYGPVSGAVHWISYKGDYGTPASPFAPTLFGAATPLAHLFACDDVPGVKGRGGLEHVRAWHESSDGMELSDKNLDLTTVALFAARFGWRE